MAPALIHVVLRELSRIRISRFNAPNESSHVSGRDSRFKLRVGLHSVEDCHVNPREFLRNNRYSKVLAQLILQVLSLPMRLLSEKHEHKWRNRKEERHTCGDYSNIEQGWFCLQFFSLLLQKG